MANAFWGVQDASKLDTSPIGFEAPQSETVEFNPVASAEGDWIWQDPWVQRFIASLSRGSDQEVKPFNAETYEDYLAGARAYQEQHPTNRAAKDNVLPRAEWEARYGGRPQGAPSAERVQELTGLMGAEVSPTKLPDAGGKPAPTGGDRSAFYGEAPKEKVQGLNPDAVPGGIEGLTTDAEPLPKPEPAPKVSHPKAQVLRFAADLVDQMAQPRLDRGPGRTPRTPRVPRPATPASPAQPVRPGEPRPAPEGSIGY